MIHTIVINHDLGVISVVRKEESTGKTLEVKYDLSIWEKPLDLIVADFEDTISYKEETDVISNGS